MFGSATSLLLAISLLFPNAVWGNLNCNNTAVGRRLQTTLAPTGAPAAATSAPIAATSAPVAATSAPTTIAPVAATIAPVAATSAPVAATSAPIAATSAPVATTSAPTTIAPVAATIAPVAATIAPVAATIAPVAATIAPVATTIAPVAATSAPVAATSAPTTSAPVAATSAPVAATSAPTTSAPVAATSAPIATTSAPTSAPIVAAPTFPTLRINCGGAAYTDSQGKDWAADEFFQGGGAFGAGSAVVDAPLYGTERFFSIWQHTIPFTYEIPVPPGEYGVVLHFAEVFFQVPNGRVFDLWLEGSLLQSSLDIYGEVGFEVPYVIYGTTSVSDGFLTVELAADVENPKIAGIEVYDAANYAGPTISPTVSPAPTLAPVTMAPSVSRAPTSYNNIYINCGGAGLLSNNGEKFWQEDIHFIGGGVYIDGTNEITPTQDDGLFHSERYGTFTYEIPIPVGSYEVTVHMAELYFTGTGQRKFKLTIENTEFNDVDIVQLGGGPYISTSLESAEIISDGFLTISVEDSFPKVDQGKISAIEVKLLGPHLAHSVANGPYRAVDIDNTGTADVVVDGGPSHTHGTGMSLTGWTWKEGATVVGTGETATLTLPVGEHTIALTVVDSGGNESTEATTVTILPFGHPAAVSLSPSSGSITGGDTVTITGSGFTYSSAQTTVHFGLVDITGSALTIVDQYTIQVTAPPTVVGAPVTVSIETPLDVSNGIPYNYIGGVPINFDTSLLFNIDSPTVTQFGPDRCLYVGTINGDLARVCMNDDFTEVVDTVVSVVSEYRCILGIAFDPLDTKAIPDVYISTSFFFHGSPTSTSGDSINGDIRKVSGSNLDVVEDVITGLPVSDHDHGLNGMVFGGNGELYFGIGSNTNGGIPGQLTGSQVQKENYYSAAVNVAYMADPGFDGQITYSAPDDGNPSGGSGVEVFASGVRNPYGLTMHSNGKLYGTDNGPNLGYGDSKFNMHGSIFHLNSVSHVVMTGCGANDFITDQEEEDKVLLLNKDAYYGHPNPKRAAFLNEPRQCVWRSQLEPSDSDYTAPLVNVQSSTDGIIEYAYDHFDGQLRGNLIASVYQGPLLRVILDPTGEAVIPQSNPALLLVNADTSLPVGADGLDVTQAPNGNLVECRISDSTIYVHKPNEPASSTMAVKGVFPHRGSITGGSTLDVYGVNFSGAPVVTVGGKPCPVLSTSSSKIGCTIPAGVGLVDIVVTIGASTSTFSKGYRYVSGQPGGPATNPPTESPTSIPTTVQSTTAPSTQAPITVATPTTTPSTVPGTFAPAAFTVPPTTAPGTLAPIGFTVSPTTAPTTAPSTLAPVDLTVFPTTIAPTVGQSIFVIDAGSPADIYATSPNGVRIDEGVDPIANAATLGYSMDFFQHARSADAEMTYTIPGFGSGASAEVELGFAELWGGACDPGARVQSITVNGQAFLTNYDIAVTAGGCNTAVVESGTFNANFNGEFVIAFVGSANNPLVSVIAITTGPAAPVATSAPAFTAAPITAATSAPTTTTATQAPAVAPVVAQNTFVIDAGSPADIFATSPNGVRIDEGVDPIANAVTLGYSMDVFQHARSADAEMTYTIPGFGSGASAEVELGFAELWGGACDPGARVQSIMVNGQAFLTNYDIAVTAGGCNTAVVESGTFNANFNGEFVITFVGSANNPLVSVIAITTATGPVIPVATSAPATATVTVAPAVAPISNSVLIDAGSPTDTFATSPNGVRVDEGVDPIANAVSLGYSMDVFQHARSADAEMTYTIPGFGSGASAEVELGFAELWGGACDPGARVQSITVNGQAFLTDYDIAVTAGGCNTAVVESGTFNANFNGEFVIAFVGSANNPLVSTIQIVA